MINWIPRSIEFSIKATLVLIIGILWVLVLLLLSKIIYYIFKLILLILK